MNRPDQAGSILARGGMLSDEQRTKTCRCGRTFTQSKLTDRELAAAARMGIGAQFAATVPDGFVPVHCPPCESKDLASRARREDRHPGSAHD